MSSGEFYVAPATADGDSAVLTVSGPATIEIRGTLTQGHVQVMQCRGTLGVFAEVARFDAAHPEEWSTVLNNGADNYQVKLRINNSVGCSLTGGAFW